MGKLKELVLSFSYNGRKYHYFCHRYNATWRNERAVEVPIIWQEIQRAKGKRVLELGNVLSHYFSINHDVVDKYEKAPRVINADVVSFAPRHRYDLIVGISTLEHVGFDEKPQESQKTVQAVKSLVKLLRHGGKLVLTFPLGYNPHLDKYLSSNAYGFDEIQIMKRISADNRWKELSVRPTHIKYNSPYPNANAIGIAVKYR